MSMSKKAALALATVAAIFTAQTSTAATVDFRGGDGSNVSQSVFDLGNVTLTVTAGTLDYHKSKIKTGNREVDLASSGLGVDDISGDGKNTDANYMDGKGGNDILVFTFSRDVELNSIDFYGVDGNDRAAIGSVSDSMFDRGPKWARLFDNMTGYKASTVVGSALTSVDEQRTGMSFGVAAIRDYHNFRVAGLDFTVIADDPVSAVRIVPTPLPATGLMLLGALGLGAGIARRRARS